jgi:hypothetical protein
VKQNASPITVSGGRGEVSQWLCWSAGLLSVLRAGGVAGINDAICLIPSLFPEYHKINFARPS